MCRAPVFEASARSGGVGASDRDNGFTFDRGIHVLQTRNAKILDLLSDIGVEMRSHQRRAYIYSHGAYSPYPFQVNTAALPFTLRARCVGGYLGRERDAKPRNYEEWIYSNLGRGFADTFLIPYSEKFWTVHPREMTHEWTGNRVPQPTTAQVLRGAFWNTLTQIGTNSDFRYPAGEAGYGTIGEALTREAGAVHTGHRALRLDTVTRTVHFDNGTAISYECLVSTIPLPDLIAMCPHAPARVREAAARLRANSILVVNLGIGRRGVNDWHWVHYPERDLSFFRISFPHNLGGELVPPGTSAISAEVAYSQQKPVDRDGIVQRVIDDLIRVRILRIDDPIIHRMTYDIRYGYCIYDFERKSAVRMIREWLLEHNVIAAGRYGLWSYFWSDESMVSGMQAAEKALKLVSGGEKDEPEMQVAAG